jgi:hypothetical protein
MKKATIRYSTIVRSTQMPRIRAAFRSTSPMTTATVTTIVASGIPRRSAVPVSLDRHVSWCSAGIVGTSLAGGTAEKAVIRGMDVEA